MAAVLAVATVLAVGLAVVPNSVQEAQANPCANEVEIDAESEGDTNVDTSSSNVGTSTSSEGDDDRVCDFTGPVDLDED